MSCQPGTIGYPVRSVMGYQFASRRVNAILSFLAPCRSSRPLMWALCFALTSNNHGSMVLRSRNSATASDCGICAIQERTSRGFVLVRSESRRAISVVVLISDLSSLLAVNPPCVGCNPCAKRWLLVKQLKTGERRIMRRGIKMDDGVNILTLTLTVARIPSRLDAPETCRSPPHQQCLRCSRSLREHQP